MKQAKRDRRRLILISAGTLIRRVVDGKGDRVRRDMITRALPTELPDGARGWCFRRRRRELWCCPAEDADLLAGPR